MALKFGVIGAGRIGRLHAENLAFHISKATPAAISDVILTAAEQAAAIARIPMVVEDYRKILDDSTISAVLICSSTDTHAQVMEDAAQAGKHIFCEKPIHLDLARAQQALEVVENYGVKLQIGFNRRFDPGFRRVQNGVQTGEIGEMQILRITSRDPAPPPLAYIKVSGGIFLDMMIHDFDMARFLTGNEVDEVYAIGDVRITPGIADYGDIDTAIVTMRFKNGVIGTIDNSRQAVYGYDQRVEVFGEKGMLQANNPTPNMVVATTENGATSAKPHHFFLERYREAYVAEIQAFVDAILNDTSTPVTGNDGIAPLRIALAARQSFQQGTPVKVDEIKP